NDGAISTFHRETTPITHTWMFFTATNGKKVETWEAGRHEFPFSLAFPGNLPESIDIPYAKVAYSLKAVLRRTGIMSNIVAKRDVRVKRDLTMDGAFGTGAIEVENCWRNKLEFRISSDADVYRPGDQMHAKFTFQPLVKQVHLTKIGVILKEYVRCHTPLGRAEKTVSRVAASSELVPRDRGADASNIEDVLINESLQTLPTEQQQQQRPHPTQSLRRPAPENTLDQLYATSTAATSRNRGMPNTSLFGGSETSHSHRPNSSCDPTASQYGRDLHRRPEQVSNVPAQNGSADAGIDLTHVVEECIRLKIPKEMRRLQYDHISSYIEVTHKLKFSIHFNDPDCRPHTLWISVPVSVVPTIAGSCDGTGSDLPTYANAALDPRVPMGSIEQGPPAYDAVLMETTSPSTQLQIHPSGSSDLNSCASSYTNLNSSTASIQSHDDTSLQQYSTPHPVIMHLTDSLADSEASTTASTASSSIVHINETNPSVQQAGHSLMSVDTARPLVHPNALHGFLNRPVVFPASAESTPLQTPLASPGITPMESPLVKASG
ncbi:hypothetical protein H4S06_004411, partial [Coemansia sp. BCRC 34490]